MENALTILVLDDDPAIQRIIKAYLHRRHNVFLSSRPSEAMAVFEAENIDIFICDIRLPEMDGITFIKKVKEKYPEVEIIMISSHAGMEEVVEIMHIGAFDFFKKPFDLNDIQMSIERTSKYRDKKIELKQSELKKTFLNKELHEKIGYEIVSVSNSMEIIKQTMAKVAQADDTSVLITGESGTGKELVARGIHMLSNRSDEFFGAVNTSAIPEPLFESEFFGHKKGSFTGAIQEKEGWFEVANNGTLFLDEIGDMPITLQIKMLRVLEDRRFNKVGSPHAKSFNIRIIAATNKDVESLKSGDKFRSDLFYRISTFQINIPPLRDRPEDIPVLADHFLQFYALKMKKPLKSIAPGVNEILLNYNFPGNVRELRNLCERAVILNNGGVINESCFPEISGFTKPPESNYGNVYNLDEIERRTILEALSASGNNLSKASKLLGLQWNALYLRIQKYNIRAES
ncbi:MAG TPA: sigma-54 dependent transcriptional regulator [Bacteroidales bacterium]|nr:sigma-54 dependent transcriptional regulator [Bacteroidales bacterium]HRX96769.1 sigma-54 dependent transcriptional regulator [Bacteroidales bacterium]